MLVEDRIVCLCDRQNFNSTQWQQLINICQNHQISWDKVFDIAQEQYIAPLVHMNLLKNGQALQIPQAILSKFKKAYIHSEDMLLGREFSWPLVLTYATYRLDHLGPKLGEIYAAWRNPPPPVPGRRN